MAERRRGLFWLIRQQLRWWGLLPEIRLPGWFP